MITYNISNETYNKNNFTVSAAKLCSLTDFSDRFASNVVTGLSYVNGKVFAVGIDSTMMVSSDSGDTWSYCKTFDKNTKNILSLSAIYKVRKYGSKYLGYTSLQGILSSDNGIEWLYSNPIRSEASRYPLATVQDSAYDGTSVYLLAGTDGRVAVSTNLINWTISSTSSNLKSTTWGNADIKVACWHINKFVILGAAGACATSSDGLTWTYQSQLSTVNAINAQTAASNGTIIVAGGDSGVIVTSTDSITWTNQTSLSLGTWGAVSPVYSIVWTGTQFVAGGGSGKIATSPDGVTWTYRSGLSSTTWGTTIVSEIVWANNLLIAINVSNSNFATSSDGITWSYNQSLTNNTLWSTAGITSICYGDGTYKAFGSAGTLVAHSTDLSNWIIDQRIYQDRVAYGYTTGLKGTPNVVYDGTKYVMVDSTARVFYSYNSTDWYYSRSLYSAWGSLNSVYVYSLVWTGTKFVTVGDNGKVATSTDGITWTNQIGLSSTAWGTGTSVLGIVWTGTQFVVCGGLGKIATSPDGITWTNQTGLSSGTWSSSTPVNGIVWTGTQLVVCGNSGKVATSTDGVTWTYQSGLSSTAWGTINAQSIVWSGTTFVVVGASGNIASSTDAITWTKTGLSNNNFYSVVWTGTKFIIGGNSLIIATSTDGSSWSSSYTLTASNNYWPFGYPLIQMSSNGSGGIVAVGGNATNNSILAAYSSNNGDTWTNLHQPLLAQSSVISYSASTTVYWKGYYYIGSNNSSTGGIVRSSNGTTWSTVYSSSQGPSKLIGTPDRLFAIGANSLMMNSLDGSTWDSFYGARLSLNTGVSIYAHAYSGSTHIVGGTSGKLSYSYNLIDWFTTNLDSTGWGSSQSVECAIWTGTQFVIGGGSGYIATSPDGVKWTWRSGLSSTSWGAFSVYSIAWNGSTLVAVGTNSRVATSADGITWTYQSGLSSTGWGSTNDVNSIVWTGSQFVVAGSNGKIATSTDGITWTNQTGLSSTTWSTSYISSIVWTGTKLIVAGWSGKIATSPDGITWTYQSGLSSTAWGTTDANCLVWTGNIAVVSGNLRSLATSTDGITWTVSSSVKDSFITNAPLFLVAYADNKLLVGSNSSQLAISKSTTDLNFRYVQYLAQPKLSTILSTAPSFNIGERIVILGTDNTVPYVAYTDDYGKTANFDYTISDYGRSYRTQRINKLAYGNNIFVGVMNSPATIVYSKNGVQWYVSPSFEYGTVDSEYNYRSPNSQTLYDVVYNGSVFLAVGSYARALISTDGINWKNIADLSLSGFSGSTDVYCVVWSGTQFVVGGAVGKIATSPDGLTWTNQSGLSATAWGTTNVLALAWTGTQFVAVGASGKVATSTDGITWTNQTGLSSTAWATGSVYTIVWTGTQLVVGGGSGKIATSTDGITWTNQTGLSSTAWSTAVVNSIIWTGTELVAVGGTNPRVSTSTDGVTWTTSGSLTTGGTEFFSIIKVGSGYYVSASSCLIGYTNNLSGTWYFGNTLSKENTTILKNYAYLATPYRNNGMVVAAAQLFNTSDYRMFWEGVVDTIGPKKWVSRKNNLTSTTYGSSLVQSIVWAGDKFVLGGDNARVATSPDGITWTYQSGLSSTAWTSTYDILNLQYLNSTIFAVGLSGRLATSTNGTTWTYQSGLSSLPQWGSNLVRDITWTGSKYVAVGGLGRVATSTDGVTWTYQSGLSSTSWGTNDIRAIKWTGTNLVVSAADTNITAYSTDGITWTVVNTSAIAKCMLWTGKYLLIGCTNSDILKSIDHGLTWTTSSTLKNTVGWINNIDSTLSEISGLQYINNTLMAIGKYGNIAISKDDGNVWKIDKSLVENQQWDIHTNNLVSNPAWNGSQLLIGGQQSNLAAYIPVAEWLVTSNLANSGWGTSAQINTIAKYSGASYVAGGANGKIATSSDGITWTNQTSLSSGTWGTTTAVKAIAWNGTTLVAISDVNGKCATSTDGITWTYRSGLASVYAGDRGDIIWTGSEFISCGQNGSIVYSADGITWASRGNLFAVWSFSSSNCLAYNGSTLVVSGTNNYLAYSTDLGVTWTNRTTELGTLWSSSGQGTTIVWTGNSFILAGSFGKVATSPDGITWSNQNGLRAIIGTSTDVNKLVWTGSEVIAFCNSGVVATSPDGITWTLQYSLQTSTWSSTNITAAVTNGTKVVIGGAFGRSASLSIPFSWSEKQNQLKITLGNPLDSIISYNDTLLTSTAANGASNGKGIVGGTFNNWGNPIDTPAVHSLNYYRLENYSARNLMKAGNYVFLQTSSWDPKLMRLTIQ